MLKELRAMEEFSDNEEQENSRILNFLRNIPSLTFKYLLMSVSFLENSLFLHL